MTVRETPSAGRWRGWGRTAKSIHGKGVRVIYQPSERASFTVGGIESFHETARRNRLNVVTKVVRFEEAVVDQRTAEESGFPAGEQVYNILRVRSLFKVPGPRPDGGDRGAVHLCLY